MGAIDGVMPCIVVSLIDCSSYLTLPLPLRNAAPTYSQWWQASSDGLIVLHVEVFALLGFQEMVDIGTPPATFSQTMNTSAPRLKIFVGDVAIDSGDEGHDRDHRGHADDHAESVSTERSLLAHSDCRATRMASAIFMCRYRPSWDLLVRNQLSV